MIQRLPTLSKHIRLLTLCMGFAFASVTMPQTLTEEFLTAGYALTDLGSIADLPPSYGGLTIRPSEPNTLYIGGAANQAGAAIYTVPLVREAGTNLITGFAGPAVHYADAPNVDGGLHFAPNGTLLFTRYSNNELGQILPDQTYISTPLTPLGLTGSVGSLALVPQGHPGAGNLIFSSYSSSVFYHVPYTLGSAGEYLLAAPVAEISVASTASGPEGIAYVPGGSAGFPELSMAVSSYGSGTIIVYEADANGLPDVSTSRVMVQGMTGAEGALIDPVTGDFLFSTFGGNDRVIRISGFEAPTAISDHQKEAIGLFPNPTGGLFQIDINGNWSQLEVLNALGEKLVSRQLPGNGPHFFDLSAYPQGIYFVQMLQDDRKWVERLVKE